MTVKFYQVGGCVRDELLGIKSKDIDYSVEASSYEAMRAAIVERVGGEHRIKVENREFVTIRAVDPKLGGVDFVLCRKEGEYTDGRRPDKVEVGTLADDLARRDFTVNAMAKDDNGNIIDLFGGQEHLKRRVLFCVGDTEARLREDSLRMLRAIRFSITKGFAITLELHNALLNRNLCSLLSNVSIERVREELKKCFDFDTALTLKTLEEYPHISHMCFRNNVLRLEPTLALAK